MNTQLTESQLKALRSSGVISKEEIAFLSGDLLVVENVLTNQRRILEEGKSVLRETRRILKG